MTNIFVTIGSQKFQFNRLLREMDYIASQNGDYHIFAQIGKSDYEPVHYEYKRFMDKEEFEKEITNADVIITHGGTGVIIGASKRGKRIVAVPRRMKFGEHVDDHQKQIVQAFEKAGYICACYDIESLDDIIKNALEFEPKKFVSNRKKFIKALDKAIQS